MFPRALLAAALAAVCIHEAHSAVPFVVNHTELRRTHPLGVTNSQSKFWGRRRARDTQIQLTTSPPLQTTSPPLGPYWANYSLVGQEVGCSDDAKRCLAINRLLHEPSGSCYELGDTRPCDTDGAVLVLDAESFRRGQLRTRCSEPDSCKAFSMAYDGKCYEAWDIFGKLCDGGKEFMFHPFGGLECKIPKEMREIGNITRQPKSLGRCIVPNLQNTDIGPFWVECSTAEEECLKRGLLPFGGSCHAPLTNTSCPKDQWLVFDEGTAETGRLSAKCVSSRPCGSDAQLLREDGSCHSHTELFEKLCNGYYVLPLPTGDFICAFKNRQYEVLGLRKENGLCEVQIFPNTFMGASGAIWVGEKNCVTNDQNVCQSEVVSPNPKPVPVSEE